MTYYIDHVLTPEESAAGFYTIAIRRHGEPGWTYRFQSFTEDAKDTLWALNAPANVAA